MRGNNSRLTSKLHILLYISAPSWQIFHEDFYNRDSFDETIEMRGNNPMLTSNLHILLNILTPC